MKKSFSETGYIVVRNAISERLIKDIQSEIYNLLEINEDNQNKKYLKFCDLVNNLKISEILLMILLSTRLTNIFFPRPMMLKLFLEAR